VIAATVVTGELPLMLLAWATVALTFLYSLKMTGLVFLGRKSEHIMELEKHGHHVHEAPATMWVPYLILALATVAIGLAGPFIESSFVQALTSSTTPVVEVEHRATVIAEEDAVLIASMGSIMMLAIGGAIGYLVYISRKIDPSSIIGPTGRARAIYNFLWNRWYLNPLYYRAFVYGTLSAANSVKTAIETRFFDRISGAVANASIRLSEKGQQVDLGVIDAAIDGVASQGRKYSSVLKRIQTGVAQEYVMVFALGLFALIVAVLFLM